MSKGFYPFLLQSSSADLPRSRQVEWTPSEGTSRFWMYRDRALIPDSMVIQAVPATNGHTLIIVPLANVYLDSPTTEDIAK